MNDANKFSLNIIAFGEKVIENVKKAQRETAEKVWEDVRALAPSTTGEYAESIKVSDTEYKDGVIKTSVYSDLVSSDGHAIGRMIEYGTGIYALQPHIGKTKTFVDSQYNYWYVPAKSVNRQIGMKIFIKGELFYLAKPQPAKPHFLPALNKNIALYRENIRKAIKEAKNR